MTWPIRTALACCLMLAALASPWHAMAMAAASAISGHAAHDVDHTSHHDGDTAGAAASCATACACLAAEPAAPLVCPAIHAASWITVPDGPERIRAETVEPPPRA